MRPLVEKETTAEFEKLFKFVGNNLKNIVENPSHEGPDPNPGCYCFRLQKNKVYYTSESLVKRATNIARPTLFLSAPASVKSLMAVAFTLRLTCQTQGLAKTNIGDVVSVWKPCFERGLGRITENIASGDGVVVFSMSDIPLGFGIAAKSTQDCRKLDPNGIVVLHQSDIGEYLRMEDEL